MTTVEVSAPAKVNLTLHVTGRRPDGYHLLDSLVTFVDVGDTVLVRPADTLSLRVTGPFSDAVSVQDNLVLDAARLIGVPAEITLDKRLPVAAGIGGGSADAAATLIALSKMSGRPIPNANAQLQLGADVPACVAGGVLRMQGIGDKIKVLDGSPLTLPMVLVNPGAPVSTPAVFSALRRRENAPQPVVIPACTAPDFLDWLAKQRNDLEGPAQTLAPVIGEVLSALAATPGAAISRMSGSGATCFALYRSKQDAANAVADIRRDHPGWWAEGSSL